MAHKKQVLREYLDYHVFMVQMMHVQAVDIRPFSHDAVSRNTEVM